MTSEILKLMVSDLGIKFPVATVSRDLKISKGVVSEYLNGKKIPSDNFKKLFENFYEVYVVDYKDMNDTTKISAQQNIQNKLDLQFDGTLIPFQVIADHFVKNKEEFFKYSEHLKLWKSTQIDLAVAAKMEDLGFKVEIVKKKD
jgi:hypothetical protein